MDSVVDGLQTVAGYSIVVVLCVVAETLPLIHIGKHVVDPLLEVLVVRLQDPIFLDPKNER